MRIFGALLLVAAFVAACGGPDPTPPPAVSRAGTDAPRFGDTDPHDWQAGRTPAAPSGARHRRVALAGARSTGARSRNSGVAFAWPQGDRGRRPFADPLFADHSGGAARAGVPVGAYHFFYLCTDAATRRAGSSPNVPRRAGALPPVLDIEFNHASRTCRTRPDPAVIRAEIATFQRIVGAHYGRCPVIYTTPDFRQANDPGRLRGEEFWLRSVAGHPFRKDTRRAALAVLAIYRHRAGAGDPGRYGYQRLRRLAGAVERLGAWAGVRGGLRGAGG